MTHTANDHPKRAPLRDMLQRAVDVGEVAGVVSAVQVDGEPLIEAVGYRDIDDRPLMEPDTLFNIASMTKAVTAVAALHLRDAGHFALDDAIDRWIPELADLQVLRSPDSSIDDTVPAERPIIVRDLLRLTLGTGLVLAPPGSTPIMQAYEAADLMPSFLPPSMDADMWIARLGALPLIHQPGGDWMYHTGFQVLGVLVERVTGQSLAAVLKERIFDPLGMVDTGFGLSATGKLRLATGYRLDETGKLQVLDPEMAGNWSNASASQAAAGDLLSTAPDYLRFGQMLLSGGVLDGVRILSEASVREMSTDQVTAAEKSAWPGYRTFIGESGWGYGVSVLNTPDEFGWLAGSYGWGGGLNTHWRNDPHRQVVALLLFQREMTGPDEDALVESFWRFASGMVSE